MFCNIFWDGDALLFAIPLQYLNILFKSYNFLFNVTFNLIILLAILMTAAEEATIFHIDYKITKNY